MSTMSKAPAIVLASGSVYRRELLQRILTEFESVTPEVDEAPSVDESPQSTALRLSKLKAFSCAKIRPDALVIGSDQVPALENRHLDKPGSHERAVAQLQACAGKTVVFYTAVSIVGPGIAPMESYVDETIVKFRPLGEAQIQRYLELERPYDCAGSFKAEALGIVLFEKIENRDPTALQGLPLIWLAKILRQRGVDLP
jgi:septum formation protein